MERFEEQLTALIIFAITAFQKVFIQYKKVVEVGVEGSGTVNFDIPSRSFTVILLITFDFQHFLT